MTAPGNGLLLTSLLIVFTVSVGYAAGRVHQWYRASLERDEAYREGYDTATRSLFSVAARLIRPRRSETGTVRGTATVAPASAVPAAGMGAPGMGKWFTDPGSARTVIDVGGRHKLRDELAHTDGLRRTPIGVRRRGDDRPFSLSAGPTV
jgi:hypothetical protein